MEGTWLDLRLARYLSYWRNIKPTDLQFDRLFFLGSIVSCSQRIILHISNATLFSDEHNYPLQNIHQSKLWKYSTTRLDFYKNMRDCIFTEVTCGLPWLTRLVWIIRRQRATPHCKNSPAILSRLCYYRLMQCAPYPGILDGDYITFAVVWGAESSSHLGYCLHGG